MNVADFQVGVEMHFEKRKVPPHVLVSILRTDYERAARAYLFEPRADVKETLGYLLRSMCRAASASGLSIEDIAEENFSALIECDGEEVTS